MEYINIFLCSSVIASAISAISSIINTLINSKMKKLSEKNSELESKNAELKQQNSDLVKRLQEYQEKDSAELNTQIITHRHQAEDNASYISWDN